jgi:hypothetical protein
MGQSRTEAGPRHRGAALLEHCFDRIVLISAGERHDVDRDDPAHRERWG